MAYGGSKAQAGRSSMFSIGASPTEIGEVTAVQFNRGEWQTVEVTNFDSGLDAEFQATIRSNGTVGLKFNRVSSDAGQVALEAAYQSGAVTSFTLQLPKAAAQSTSGDKYVFNAIAEKSNFNVDTKSIIEGDAQLKISGSQPLTPGT